MIRFKLSGKAYRVATEGNFPNDNPRAGQALNMAHTRRAGHGFRATVLMEPADARDLMDYLKSVIEAEDSMTYDERGSNDSRKACRDAIESIKGAFE